MEPRGESRPALPLEGAFVVQFGATAAVAEGCLCGRVEHIVSAQATHFHSSAELLAFMQQVLTERPTVPPEAR